MAKSDYYRAAYDQTRAELLKEVDKAWETSIPPELPDFGPGDGPSSQTSGIQYLQQKLNNIIIPDVDFEDVTVQEALETLRIRAREFDIETDEDKKGINFIIRESGVQAGGSDGFDDDQRDRHQYDASQERARYLKTLLVSAPTGHRSMTLPDNSESTLCSM